ncbi:uncharacterized protein F5Z01DRAFT_659044 [Emericellopsis atlantica]|uniref:Uncharacterized protein n=1 Tax=Emericellopsis atlantica TaxID=2614577 RepID=A0A9P8CMT5_9HYPO|nr:uncharacterized protein F5Z01DRAFT_659044 [Emericellopsis atlantica]KAG9253049.1 hypothetical protein F5Z01DRAFT_659044 [Emericellopsis atlantica]
MPVTTRPSTNAPREWRSEIVTSPETHLEQTARRESEACKEIFQASFYPDHNISPASNGLVSAALDAYSSHHHLILRPEDVWFSILTQLSFYINANAENLRKHFVAHQGKKELVVEAVGTIYTVDLGRMAVSMTGEMHKFVVDKDLRQWILPDFSTTTDNDTVVAAGLFMGAMQEYFTYKFRLLCGIPSVTLLGEKHDWVRLRDRLEKIDEWGTDAQEFALRLKKVLDFFVRTFDEPEGSEVIEFWSKIAHYKGGGSGPTWISGWMTAFCRWDNHGKRAKFEVSEHPWYSRSETAECELDGITFESVESKNIPLGYTKVPALLDDNGTIYNTEIVAGMVGVAVSSSGEGLDDSNPNTSYGLSDGGKDKNGTDERRTGLDTLQPVSGWWMYDVTERAST